MDGLKKLGYHVSHVEVERLLRVLDPGRPGELPAVDFAASQIDWAHVQTTYKDTWLGLARKAFEEVGGKECCASRAEIRSACCGVQLHSSCIAFITKLFELYCNSVQSGCSAAELQSWCVHCSCGGCSISLQSYCMFAYFWQQQRGHCGRLSSPHVQYVSPWQGYAVERHLSLDDHVCTTDLQSDTG